MKTDQFAELLKSVKEMKMIKAGKKPASRTFIYEEHEVDNILSACVTWVLQ